MVLPQHATGLNFISSITSVDIERIIINRFHGFEETLVRHGFWTQLEDALCQLVDRPKYKLQLEVKFIHSRRNGTPKKPDLKAYFPRFHERGRMVVDYEDEPIFCSDPDCRGSEPVKIGYR